MQSRMRPVLLVGGSGSRLAPISTPDCPKPFIPLPRGGSLLQQTLARIAPFEAPILIGQAMHRFALMNHAHEAGAHPAAILLEPKPCNTAMAIAAVTAWMIAQGEGATVLAILPADHAIDDEQGWRHALTEASLRAQASDTIQLLAMTPDAPSSELGYMQLQGRNVVAFREKPKDAARLLAEGWRANSGQFVARASVLANALQRHAPQTWAAACSAIEQGRSEREFFLLAQEPYTNVLPIAFDRAVLEKTRKLEAIACQCGWRDIGTIAAFARHAALGTGDIHPPAYKRNDRPWGFGETIAESARSIAKCLTIYPGRRLSLQRHAHRIEVWLVIEGEAMVELEGDYIMLGRGESLTIPQHAWHRLINAGESNLVIMELQVGRPDEEDIERKEDDYGRV